ncbi:MAG: hypothetical protein AAF135_14505, partial [Bacteroidota bacterium]
MAKRLGVAYTRHYIDDSLAEKFRVDTADLIRAKKYREQQEGIFLDSTYDEKGRLVYLRRDGTPFEKPQALFLTYYKNSLIQDSIWKQFTGVTQTEQISRHRYRYDSKDRPVEMWDYHDGDSLPPYLHKRWVYHPDSQIIAYFCHKRFSNIRFGFFTDKKQNTDPLIQSTPRQDTYAALKTYDEKGRELEAFTYQFYDSVKYGTLAPQYAIFQAQITSYSGDTMIERIYKGDVEGDSLDQHYFPSDNVGEVDLSELLAYFRRKLSPKHVSPPYSVDEKIRTHTLISRDLLIRHASGLSLDERGNSFTEYEYDHNDTLIRQRTWGKKNPNISFISNDSLIRRPVFPLQKPQTADDYFYLNQEITWNYSTDYRHLSQHCRQRDIKYHPERKTVYFIKDKYHWEVFKD